MPKQLEFTFKSGPQQGKTFTFKSQTVAIGGGNENDLIIKDKSVTKLHALVTVEAQGIVLQNRSVVGATFVNGERVERCLLNNDDLIEFGGGIGIKFSSTEVQEGFQAPFRMPEISSFRLQVDKGPMKWTNYEFSRELVKVGSQRGCDLLLSEQGVEPVHFEITFENNEFVLYNAAESGVKVNGKLVERKALQKGDRILFGADSAVVFTEIITDVRLAKPRTKKQAEDLKQMKRKTSLFKNPVFLGAVGGYFFFLVMLVFLLLRIPPKEPEVPFGGGFGFHSLARRILVSKSVGSELYEYPLVIRGNVAEGESYKIVSGPYLIFDSEESTREQMADESPYKASIISDQAKSTESLALSRECHANKNIAPEALFKTVLYLRRAEAYCPRSEATLANAIKDELHKAEQELSAFFEDLWLKAYMRTKAGDIKGAEEVYAFLRKLMPDERNPGNVYARNAQIRVTGGGG